MDEVMSGKVVVPMELVAFLKERLDEDAELARRANRRPIPVRDVEPAEAAHVLRWDPARVLAEVEAKKEILKLHLPEVPVYEPSDSDRRVCRSCGAQDGWYDMPAPCPTLQLLAQPYIDHPDFEPAWAQSLG